GRKVVSPTFTNPHVLSRPINKISGFLILIREFIKSCRRLICTQGRPSFTPIKKAYLQPITTIFIPSKAVSWPVPKKEFTNTTQQPIVLCYRLFSNLYSIKNISDTRRKIPRATYGL